MAENKKSFVLYADLIHTVKKMPKDKAGELFLTILSYVNDENPVIEDMTVDLVFEPIKRQMKRDLQKYEAKKALRAAIGKEGGLKSGESRRAKSEQNEAIENASKQNEAIASNVKQNEHDTVNVNDNVNDNVFINKKGWEVMPKPEHVGDLPELQIENAIMFVKLTKQTDIPVTKVIGMWGVFKIQNLTGKKYYADVGAIYTHFSNWIKMQKFELPDVRAPQQGLLSSRVKEIESGIKKVS